MGIINYFSFNYEDSDDYGVYVGGQMTYNAPRRDVTKVSIPGKNGDLIKDNGRWHNVPVTYSVVIMDDFINKADAIKAWLTKPKGYARLLDSFNPGYFRLARLDGPIDFETKGFNGSGKTQITFDCKPQKFLTSGESLVPVTTSISNPTNFESKPLIRITCAGSGTVNIGTYSIFVQDISTYVDVDCEIQDCFAGSTSLNNKVTLTNGFPVLGSGTTNITYTGNVTAVQIAGRWYTL